MLIPNEKLPLAVQKALLKVGGDIRDARKRRRIPTAIMAQRMFVSRTTLLKVEQGDCGVSLGAFATALFVLGMIERFADIAEARFDQVGMSLDEERLPKRIRSRKPT